jgi:hypothetical protein
MTKSFHPGNAAGSGIVAAKLAGRGFLADQDIIETRYGYADCFGSEKCYLPGMTQFLGTVSYIASLPSGDFAANLCKRLIANEEDERKGVTDFDVHEIL